MEMYNYCSYPIYIYIYIYSNVLPGGLGSLAAGTTRKTFFALQVPLGRLLDATWTPLVPLERLLDGSWALLDALQALSKCILHSKWAPTALPVLSKWPPSATWAPLGPPNWPSGALLTCKNINFPEENHGFYNGSLLAVELRLGSCFVALGRLLDVFGAQLGACWMPLGRQKSPCQ